MSNFPPEYVPYPEAMPGAQEPMQSRQRRKRPWFIVPLLVSLALLACYLILNAVVFRVGTVAVIGNQAFSWEQVVKQARLDGNVGFIGLDAEKVKTNINANRYLVFEGMEKRFPNALTLYVRERKADIDMQVMGITYRLDGDGMVLERDGAVNPTGERVLVSGVQAREIRVGKMLVPILGEQIDHFRSIMQELQLQQLIGEVAEVNLADPSNLYMVMRNGLIIHLGDSQYMQAKIGTVRAVVMKLRELGQRQGSLDASVPGEAIYTPAGL